MQKYLEKYLLPVAMLLGIAFHRQLSILSPIIPWLLAFMLFITYSRVRWADIQLTRFHYILLAIQYGGSALIYLQRSAGTSCNDLRVDRHGHLGTGGCRHPGWQHLDDGSLRHCEQPLGGIYCTNLPLIGRRKW